MSNTQSEGNRMIAAFLNWKPDYQGNWAKPAFGDGFNAPDGDYSSGDRRTDEQLEFHSNWSWLMPVVEKIETLSASIYSGFAVNIGKLSCYINCYEDGRQPGVLYQTPYGFTPDSKIHAVWLAVISFITWHNTHINPKPNTPLS